MATLTRGKTFISGDTVFPADLHQLVDSATVTAIQTADISDSQITTAKIADGAITQAKLNASVTLVPAGAVMPFAMNSAPTGWLAADGTAVSRTIYADLFSAIGTVHGAGNGSTTFNLPDLRGIFVRGSGSQTISGSTYSGTFAAKQQDALKTHTHTYQSNITTGNTTAGGAYAIYDGQTTSNTGNPSTGTSDETRPANIALLYCIKF